MTANDPRSILKKHGLSPKKSFGQNFLANAGVVAKIAEACVPEGELSRASVIEIGAGTGALTAALLARAGRVVAIERDRDLVPVLQELFAAEAERATFRLVEASATHTDLGALLAELPAPRVLCGNLPYQITGQLIELAVGLAPSLARAVFMVQDEVADRLVASPGTKDYAGAVRRDSPLSCGAGLVPPGAEGDERGRRPDADARAARHRGSDVAERREARVRDAPKDPPQRVGRPR
jgi:16S rRNA (adenine1518-N6/adenine1519-N6)-dimethyltransferase